MDITCWNCRKTYSIDQNAINTALTAMGTSMLDFYDVPCPNCGKENRTKREQFEAAGRSVSPSAGAEPKMRSVDAGKARQKEREANEKKKGHKGK